ncbi:MAG: NFACT RNA binding domain-containing protein [Cytophagales bacterium]|nr:NFACT RNA binding domain-containing protein [Cytophagales bacterium]MDW8383823.1 NFACT RNA binding domain-containing protein [Flammeovirgaceae bacterium]
MINNFYFLKHLTEELDVHLSGKRLVCCFSQNKDELVFSFCDHLNEYWIKAELLPEFALVSFPREYARAKRNTIDIFEPCIGLYTTKVYVFEHERAFAIQLTENKQIIFKLFGNRANILLWENDKITDIFRKKIQSDYQINITNLHRILQQDFETFCQKGLQAVFPTLGKEIRKWLLPSNFETISKKEQWEHLSLALQQIQQKRFWITEIDETPYLLLFPHGNILYEVSSAIEACNLYALTFGKKYYFEREKQEILKELQKKEEQTKSYLQKNEEKLIETRHSTLYEEIGHIIMANLHNIPPRAKEVTLYDFYRNKEIKIKLNEMLSPQKNAENYYRKAKNQKIEIETLEKNIAQKSQILAQIQQHLQKIKEISSWKELRRYLKEHHLDKQKEEQTIKDLFKVFYYEGFEILVGKNAQNNDLLTQKYAYKEDLWLHVRDAIGSHVIIKYRSEQPVFPQTVIEKAASLAAYYSQRRHETLCPVIYTPKKYIRKPKGFPPGKVAIDREEVIMVEPMPFD